MPLKSKKQLKKCWVEYHKQIVKGESASWDCHEWARETPDIKSLPETFRSETAGCGCALGEKAGKSHKKKSPKLKSKKVKKSMLKSLNQSKFKNDFSS